ncbi:MAG: outer membrane beta-barrel protein [Luteolibacter sp.]|jgi:hypothetical protein
MLSKTELSLKPNFIMVTQKSLLVSAFLGVQLTILQTLLAGTSSVVRNEGLYNLGEEFLESVPIKWTVGTSLIYDDNVRAGQVGATGKDDSLALNPYVGASWINVTPQTTIDVFGRLGMIYYLDAPTGMDDEFAQSRLGVNVTHRFSERLRWVSRNFISYELEPDYAYGFANSRESAETLYWTTSQSLGFRWTERFATYTGISLTEVDTADSRNNDRFTVGFSNQFRYQIYPQTVGTLDYRYNDVTGRGVARDSTEHFVLLGVEHRFTPNSIGFVRAGFQHRDVSSGSDHTQPSMELGLTTRLNEQLRVRVFSRYSMEYNDTVRTTGTGDLVEYDRRDTFRLGFDVDYTLSPKLSLNSSVSYINTGYADGVAISPPGPPPGSADEELIQLTLGLAYRFTDNLLGSVGYTYTDSSSDLQGRDYERTRVSLGIQAEF